MRQMLWVRAAHAAPNGEVTHGEATRGPPAKHRRWTPAQRAAFVALVTDAGLPVDRGGPRGQGAEVDALVEVAATAPASLIAVEVAQRP